MQQHQHPQSHQRPTPLRCQLNFYRDRLSEFEPTHGPALYGMALIASRREDPELARDYFIRTIESDSAEGSMQVWSHIFLGRIYDIGCEREAAVAEYESAVGLGDDTRGAQAAARAGIAEAFGGGCGLR